MSTFESQVNPTIETAEIKDKLANTLHSFLDKALEAAGMLAKIAKEAMSNLVPNQTPWPPATRTVKKLLKTLQFRIQNPKSAQNPIVPQNLAKLRARTHNGALRRLYPLKQGE